jgi:RNA-directed DNA polymerase
MDIYTYLGHDKTIVESIAADITRYYITYKILKKSGKMRRIDAPQGQLKQIQSDFLHKILYLYKAHPLAHGFVRDKSPVTNANCHLGKKYILTIDIKNFFNNIFQTKVINSLEWLFTLQNKFTYTADDCRLFSELLCYNGGLPQGSPASPVMSNLVCLGIDRDLAILAKNNNVTITRYADDITASGDDINLGQLRNDIYHIIRLYNLVPNTKKTRFLKYYQRQVVTGIVTNKKLGVRKSKWKNLRARIHNLIRDKGSITKEEFQQMRGYIEWIRNLNPQRGAQLISQLSLVPVKP